MKSANDTYTAVALILMMLGFCILVAGVWLKAGGEMAMIIAGGGLLYVGMKCADAID